MCVDNNVVLVGVGTPQLDQITAEHSYQLTTANTTLAAALYAIDYSTAHSFLAI